jgi:ketosteroid isomerase-like protein
MGQAREVMDRITDAVMSGQRDALEQLYAADAVAETPDAGRLEGSAAIADYLMAFPRAFPDASWELGAQYESGDTAIDEGYLVGTHTGVLSTPDGEVAPTGRKVRLRECDIVTVADGVGVSHRFYYDQVDFMSQLGLMVTDTGAVPQPRAAADRPSGVPAR